MNKSSLLRVFIAFYFLVFQVSWLTYGHPSSNDSYKLIVKFCPDHVYDVEDGILILSSLKNIGIEEMTVLNKYNFIQVMIFSDEERQQMRTGAYLPPRGKNSFDIYKFRGMTYLFGAENLTLEELELIATELDALCFVEYTAVESVRPPPPPSNTPDFSHLQDYREANTGNNVKGIDIDYAWSIGIKGQGVGIADIEWGFNYNHEDLQRESYIELLPTTNHEHDNHGTAVAGVMYSIENGFGMTGMVNEADVFYGVSEIPYGRVYGIALGIENLNEGDVFLYEMQTGGQNGNYVPADYNMAVWDITMAASNAGIIVVAAAGNGAENLDHSYYNEYNARGDNGSIIVGAGTRVGRNRASFSTYGSRINLQGWGDWSVATTGYGDLYNGGPDETYTDSFSGTSSATPIVASAVVAVQSFAKNELGIILTPHEMRSLLVESGTQQGTGWGVFNLVPQPNVRDAIFLLHSMHTGVTTPSSLSVTYYNHNQVDLAWVKNEEDHDVMLVWSDNNLFGTPEEGEIYEPGQTISGGGIVLYAGADTSFEHAGIEPATTYYYRAYSYNDSLKYSMGRSISVTTLCEPFFNLPFIEDFDADTLLPACWEVVDHIGNGQVWEFGTQGFGLTGTTGNYAYLASILYGAGNSQNTDLVSPVLDLSDFAIVNLSFTHHFRQRQSNSVAGLYYSVDMGTTWTLIQQWVLTTPNPDFFTLDIDEIAGQSQVRFKWNYTGTHGFLWNIDDVEITGIMIPSQPSEITGPTTPCTGTTQIYSVVEVAHVNYAWEFPSDWIITAGHETHSVTVLVGNDSGNIIVTPGNAAGSGVSRSLEVFPLAAPVIPEVSGPVYPCAGYTITYTADELPDVVYNWTFPQGWQILSGNTTHEVTVVAGYDYGVITMAPVNECGTGAIAELEVYPENAPELISITGYESICEGSFQTFSTEYIAGAAYYWTFPQGWEIHSGQNEHTVNVFTGQESGHIKVTAQFNCDPSDPVVLDVIVNPKPEKPVITLTENILYSDAPAGNQWYNQDGKINGANNQEYMVDENGDYYVIVTLNDCSSEPSDTIEILNVGITKQMGLENIKVYPNPVADRLVLEYQGNYSLINFEVYNALGVLVLKGNFIEKKAIEVSDLAPGIYTFKFETTNSFEFRKVVR